MHGMYKNRLLPGSYSFLTGKTFEIYNKTFTNLKDRSAMKIDLSLNQEINLIDFLKSCSVFVKKV